MFSGKCDSGLTRLDGQVCLTIYCTEDKIWQSWQGYSSIVSWHLDKPSCVLNDFSERSLSEAGSWHSLRLGQQFILKFMCTIIPWYGLPGPPKFSMQLITYRECAAASNHSNSKNKADRCLLSRGDPGTQLCACRRAQWTLGSLLTACSSTRGVRNELNNLVHCIK